MATALLESVRTRGDGRKQQALADYRKLLARADRPKDDDPALLESVLAELELTPQDAERDLATLRDEAERTDNIPKLETAAEVAEADSVQAREDAFKWFRDTIAEMVSHIELQWLPATLNDVCVRAGANVPAERNAQVMVGRDEVSGSALHAHVAAVNAAEAVNRAKSELGKLRKDNPRLFGK